MTFVVLWFVFVCLLLLFGVCCSCVVVVLFAVCCSLFVVVGCFVGSYVLIVVGCCLLMVDVRYSVFVVCCCL